MAKGQSFSLDNFIKNKDGTYSKAKSVSQPRDIKFPLINGKEVDWSKPLSTERTITVTGSAIEPKTKKVNEVKTLRTLTLTLFGEPMPKQSVRATKSAHFFQPQKTVDRKKDYIRQIKEQLPKDFIRFEQRVHITKMHFLFSPLKEFHKIKGKMDAIRDGEMFYKETKPDLPDNCKKLILDSMSELVYKDDSIIVSEDNIKKYYGIGGCVIIEMQGY
jgi:Holliday junction resolvase RusA-like endonuclease